MFDTPYQTTPCSRFVLDKIATGVRKLEINEELVSVPGVEGIKLVPTGVTEFQPFLQPITRIDAKSLETSVVIDGRPLLRPDGTPVRVDQFQHTILNAKLIKLWSEGDASVRRDFLSVGDFATKSFVAWLAGAIALRLGLDLGQTAILRALTTIYYLQLHESPGATALDQDRLFVRAAKSLPGIDPVSLKTSIGDLPKLENITDYVKWVVRVIDSPRTEDLTVGFIYIAIGFSYGPQYREAITVALEYPPTFVAMVYTALNDRGYSKTALGKVIEKIINRDNHKEFIKNVNLLLKG